MKNYVVMGYFLLGIFVLILPGSAQSVRSGDYIVTLQDDTVFGFIQTISDSKINLAHESKKSMVVKKYKINALKCVVINDTVYRGVKINPPNMASSFVLMKEIEYGPVSLYKREIRKTKMWKGNEGHDFSGIMGKVVVVYYYLQKNEDTYKISEESFEVVCPQLFFDQPWIKQKFASGKYSFQNLNQLVMDYNYLVLNPIDN
jgi:hypothetical protein